jgi:SAM-dependent methyltransferase
MPGLEVTGPEAREIASFYDEALEHRLRDYIYGNERITAAFSLANSLIGRSTERVLEVGCGLGISAAELIRARDWVKVHAVDISPNNIAAANRLFGGSDRLIFEVSDMRDVPRLAPYDLITMLDVYEHIPRANWPQFNAVLGAALASDGTMVITIPSPLHQDYLARENPCGLQIVDETVHLEDLAALARDVSGILVYLKYVSIWKENDYVHAVIRRRPCYQPLNWQAYGLWGRVAARPVYWVDAVQRWYRASQRRRRIRLRLGIPEAIQ